MKVKELITALQKYDGEQQVKLLVECPFALPVDIDKLEVVSDIVMLKDQGGWRCA